METAPHRVSTNWRAGESREYRPCRDPVVNPYYVNMGYARAPATSANDSEQQSMSSVSDGDTLSLTDSSVDGVPPYRYRKQHRREMHESAKANGRVPLPHIPVSSIHTTHYSIPNLTYLLVICTLHTTVYPTSHTSE
uniref:Uncharacterized protein n=1 Tax=Hucho hucho TaxID=62062 RepID=A0A4W5NUB7_9TELE